MQNRSKSKREELLKPTLIQQIFHAKGLYIASDHHNKRLTIMDSDTAEVYLRHDSPLAKLLCCSKYQIGLDNKVLVVKNVKNIVLFQYDSQRRIISNGEIEIPEEVKSFEVSNKLIFVLTKNPHKIKIFSLKLTKSGKVNFETNDIIEVNGNTEREEVAECFTYSESLSLLCVHFSHKNKASSFEFIEISQKKKFINAFKTDLINGSLPPFRSVKLFNNEVQSRVEIGVLGVEEGKKVEFSLFALNYDEGGKEQAELILSRSEVDCWEESQLFWNEDFGFFCVRNDGKIVKAQEDNEEEFE